VYCFEQADQVGGASVEDLVLSPAASPGGLAERADALPGIGHTVVVQADALRLPPAARDGLPYSLRPDQSTAGESAVAVAIPYFQWDNRDGQAMRVWMPLGRPGEPATGDHPAARRAPLLTDNE